MRLGVVQPRLNGSGAMSGNDHGNYLFQGLVPSVQDLVQSGVFFSDSGQEIVLPSPRNFLTDSANGFSFPQSRQHLPLFWPSRLLRSRNARVLVPSKSSCQLTGHIGSERNPTPAWTRFLLSFN